MGLNSLLAKLEARDSVTSVTPFESADVTPKPAPVKACTLVTPVTPQNYNADLLAQFRLDLCANDPEPDLINRINNMAWEFMQADGMPFDQAIKAAAEIVAHCDAAACEAAYVDVMKLWEKITLRNPNERKLT